MPCDPIDLGPQWNDEQRKRARYGPREWQMVSRVSLTLPARPPQSRDEGWPSLTGAAAKHAVLEPKAVLECAVAGPVGEQDAGLAIDDENALTEAVERGERIVPIERQRLQAMVELHRPFQMRRNRVVQLQVLGPEFVFPGTTNSTRQSSSASSVAPITER